MGVNFANTLRTVVRTAVFLTLQLWPTDAEQILKARIKPLSELAAG